MPVLYSKLSETKLVSGKRAVQVFFCPSDSLKFITVCSWFAPAPLTEVCMDCSEGVQHETGGLPELISV